MANLIHILHSLYQRKANNQILRIANNDHAKGSLSTDLANCRRYKIKDAKH